MTEKKDEPRALLDVSDNIAVLTMNQPEALNAMSIRMLDDLDDALDIIEDPKSKIRAVILTGAGRGFCAGANVARMEGGNSKKGGGGRNKPLDVGAMLETHYHPLLRRLRNLPCPLVCAVNGPAAGVGMSIALMGDMVIAAKSAFFLQAFRGIGLVPDGGSTWLLPRLIGTARAKELTIMGERLPAETAHEWGLINRFCADDALMDEAREIAKKLAEGPASLAFIRQLMWDSSENNYEEQLNMERQLQRRAGRTKDFGEGVAAFNEKRKPKFTGA